MNKIIAITQRVETLSARKETRDVLDQAWISLLECCKLEPLLIPNLHTDPVGYANRLGVEGIILTGGNNLTNSIVNVYGHLVANLPQMDDLAPNRDKTEIALLNASLENEWPILGICRGMQIMNVFHGGSIRPIKEHVRTKHTINILNNRIFKIEYPLGYQVNSFHEMGINKTDIAPELLILAKAEDSIEAFIHKKYRHFGIMWHPERDDKFSEFNILLIKSFFDLQ